MAEFRSKWLDWTPESRREEVVSDTQPVAGGAVSENSEMQQGDDYFSLAGLDRDWQAALARTHAAFMNHGVQPTDATLEAAAALTLWLEEGWNRWRPRRNPRWIPEAEARRRLESILGGAAARLTSQGHVVLVEVDRRGDRTCRPEAPSEQHEEETRNRRNDDQ